MHDAVKSRRVIAMSAICVSTMIWGCSKSDQPPADYETPAAPAAPLPTTFVLGDFRKIGWLEGSWRGRLPTGSYFYEMYHLVNDSTISMGAYTDSTFKTKSDSAMIGFRNSSIIEESGGPPWRATRLDSATVEFEQEGTRKRFTWTRDAMDRWTARLYNAGANINEPTLTYLMERVKR